MGEALLEEARPSGQCRTRHDGPPAPGHEGFQSQVRTYVLPVDLEPGRTYVIWINRGRFNSFRDTKNNPAVPYLLVFRTGEARYHGVVIFARRVGISPPGCPATGGIPGDEAPVWAWQGRLGKLTFALLAAKLRKVCAGPARVCTRVILAVPGWVGGAHGSPEGAGLNNLNVQWRGNQQWQIRQTVDVSWRGVYWERPA